MSKRQSAGGVGRSPSDTRDGIQSGRGRPDRANLVGQARADVKGDRGSPDKANLVEKARADVKGDRGSPDRASAVSEPPSEPCAPAPGSWSGPALTEPLLFAPRPLAPSGLPPDRVRRVVSNGRYLAVQTAAPELLLWRLGDGAPLSAQSMGSILLPHRRVECMALEDKFGHLLVTCGRDVLLWDLRELSRSPVKLGEDFSTVTCCHLSSNDEAESTKAAAVLALGVSQHVWLLDTHAVRHLTTLRGHECAVTCVCLEGTLCAAGSESGQLKVWETQGPSLLYTSYVTAPRPVGDVIVDSGERLVAAGWGSQVTVVAETAGRWREVATAELDRPAADGRSASPRPECAVLALLRLPRPSAALFGPDHLLLAATTCGLRALNPRTWLSVFSSPDTGPEPWGGCSLALTPAGSAVVCGRTALEGRPVVFSLEVASDAVDDQLSELSIVCRSPLADDSVLRPRPAARSRPPPTPPASRVRSSGYGSAPRRTMFQPRTNASRAAKVNSSRLSLSNLPSPEDRPSESRDAPAGWHAAEYECHVTAAEGRRPLRILRQGDTLLRISLSGGGQHVACTSRQGGSLEVARLNGLEVIQDKFLMGAQRPIYSVSWNLSANKLVAASAAGIHLWNFPSGESIGGRPAEKAPLSAAQFFFMDELILASWGDTIGLFRMPEKSNAHTSLRAALRCRLPCREVLHVAGAGQFRSALAVACCSDHALRLVDLQQGRAVTTLAHAHPRPPHLARLCEGSAYVPAALPLHDVVGSAAAGDGVRLWDARCGRLAQRHAAPELRALPAGFHVSPCGRLLALGSDAAQLWLWDVRQPRGPLARLRAAAAGVSDVAFHPRRPGLLAALLDGRLQSWDLSKS